MYQAAGDIKDFWEGHEGEDPEGYNPKTSTYMLGSFARAFHLSTIEAVQEKLQILEPVYTSSTVKISKQKKEPKEHKTMRLEIFKKYGKDNRESELIYNLLEALIVESSLEPDTLIKLREELQYFSGDSGNPPEEDKRKEKLKNLLRIHDIMELNYNLIDIHPGMGVEDYRTAYKSLYEEFPGIMEVIELWIWS